MTKILIDFDSTFAKIEALDKLAEISLAQRDDAKEAVEKIKEITNLGMEGKITFPESCKRRFEILSAHKSDLIKLVDKIKENITESVEKNKKFFIDNASDIYIISGGAVDFIAPVVADFGIKKDHILANDLVFDQDDNIVGFNPDNFLAQTGGKIKAVKALNFDKNEKIIMIGDGWTDYEVRQAGLADIFIAFIENVKREKVVEKAEIIAKDFDEVKKALNF